MLLPVRLRSPRLSFALAAGLALMSASEALAQPAAPCGGDQEKAQIVQQAWNSLVAPSQRRLNERRMELNRVLRMSESDLEAEAGKTLRDLQKIDQRLGQSPETFLVTLRLEQQQKLDLLTEARTKRVLGERLDPVNNAYAPVIRDLEARVVERKQSHAAMAASYCPQDQPARATPVGVAASGVQVFPPAGPTTGPCADAAARATEKTFRRAVDERTSYVRSVAQMDRGQLERETQRIVDELDRAKTSPSMTDLDRLWLNDRLSLLLEARTKALVGERLDPNRNSFTAMTDAFQKSLANEEQANNQLLADCARGVQQTAATPTVPQAAPEVSQGRRAGGRLQYKPMSQADAAQMAAAIAPRTTAPVVPEDQESLTGAWETSGNPGGAWTPMQITQSGADVLIVHYDGLRAAGRLQGSSLTIQGAASATGSAGWTATVTNGGRQINWGNGVVWRRR